MEESGIDEERSADTGKERIYAGNGVASLKKKKP